ncbi:endonuclease/exonuclease/phosphatase family protein [Candidatus Daviesbacteria bacterium]|nr:endonuclease/exonuclease/phosphatase family protein [Candidatus Daviesbacteria bacterium]
MKLISLNTWGGKCFKPLIEFIKQQSLNTDIFCFQEMQDTISKVKQYRNIRANLLTEFKQILPDFQVFYFPVIKSFDDEANPINFDSTTGSAILVNNSIKITYQANYIVSQDQPFPKLKEDFSNLPTPLQFINCQINNKQYVIFNFHGRPMPGNKLDSPERLEEAQKVKEIIDQKNEAKILLVGDFNLLPDTKSIKIYGKNMRNLIREFDIRKTRSNLSPFYGGPNFQKYADYTFVSSDIKVTKFQVPDMPISDHLPMILEFS